ncbi:unnamed protein product [Effrenium voratum]|uniref:Uncharacterized protein n=1 Tax=Effrenium voratum TaxID=2562239 RepID=A0AA36I7X3_9DINO|nr:unnamed protein product [Effrenium voratum]
MEIGVAAAGVAAAGLKLLGYNRSNFFQNLKLKQSRKFRRQQIITAQAELFRSDVQQVIGSSVTVQERLSVVSALMLVAATHAYGLSMPPETADFLEGLFYLNLSNSTLYFLLALFSSISASILARTSQKVLLNNCVRPPFEEMMAAVDEGEEEESAERFERQDASTLFRIPGSEALLRRFGSELLHRRQRFAEAAGQNSLQRLLLRQQNNDEALQRLQYLWDDLAAYTPYYLGWGLRNLLNAYAPGPWSLRERELWEPVRSHGFVLQRHVQLRLRGAFLLDVGCARPEHLDRGDDAYQLPAEFVGEPAACSGLGCQPPQCAPVHAQSQDLVARGGPESRDLHLHRSGLHLPAWLVSVCSCALLPEHTRFFRFADTWGYGRQLESGLLR